MQIATNTGRERLIRTRLIQSFFEIFARFLSFHVRLIRTQLIRSNTNSK